MKIFELEWELKRIYGDDEGQHVYQTVIPGILSDSLKVYNAASIGNTVGEEYCLEDGNLKD